MTDSGFGRSAGYREQIVDTLAPVRPLPPPSRRAWFLVPIGLLLAASASILNGQRGDLDSAGLLLTWGLTGLQTLLGLWVLALGFREAVPGRNLSRRAIVIAAGLTTALLVSVTVLTNTASATFVPTGREWQYWRECVVWPMAIGAPFAVLSTLMSVRAFPTRPAIAGGLCGLSAGILSDAGWRLSCWISEPSHIIGAHGVAMLGLALAGSLLAVVADRPRWRRFRA